jgi:hypothetical protein
MSEATFHCKYNGVDFEVDPSDPEAEQKVIHFLRSLEPVAIVTANAKLKDEADREN